LLVNVTAEPPAGAATERVTVQESAAPGARLAAAQDKDDTPGIAIVAGAAIGMLNAVAVASAPIAFDIPSVELVAVAAAVTVT
ncbi:MAG TPA: hypothetical protein VHB50_04195, partial [Bryobacteraceae bacterium]|nr:hypothetical protein [Bryobacteraceae bacterium]